MPPQNSRDGLLFDGFRLRSGAVQNLQKLRCLGTHSRVDVRLEEQATEHMLYPLYYITGCARKQNHFNKPVVPAYDDIKSLKKHPI